MPPANRSLAPPLGQAARDEVDRLVSELPQQQLADGIGTVHRIVDVWTSSWRVEARRHHAAQVPQVEYKIAKAGAASDAARHEHELSRQRRDHADRDLREAVDRLRGHEDRLARRGSYEDPSGRYHRGLGDIVALLGVVLAGVVSMATFFQVLAAALQLSATLLLMVVTASTALNLYLMRLSGENLRQVAAGHRGSRIWLSVVAGLTWALLGASAFTLRLVDTGNSPVLLTGTERSNLSDALLFLALYVVTGASTFVGGYLTKNELKEACREREKDVARARAREQQTRQRLHVAEAAQTEAHRQRYEIEDALRNIEAQSESEAHYLKTYAEIEIARRLERQERVAAQFDATMSLVRKAFAQAERPVRETDDAELFQERRTLVVVPRQPALSKADVERYETYMTRGVVSFIVHQQPPQPDAASLLDELRVTGYPIVLIKVDALRSALLDGRVSLFLDELEGSAGARDALFETKIALIDDRFLFGRDSLLAAIGRAIHGDEHLLVTGLRKVGKTSLLNIARQHLVSYPVCSVDLQLFERSSVDWPEELFREMVESFDRWGRAEFKHWPFESAAPPSANALARALDQRLQHADRPDVRLVLILDELERVFPKGEDGSARRWVQASGALRALCQSGRRALVVVGADLRPTINRTNDLGDAGTNPFFSFFREVAVPTLDASATREMIDTILRIVGAGATSEFHRRVFNLSGGHPMLARMIAGMAYRHRPRGEIIDVHDLDGGLADPNEVGKVGFLLKGIVWDHMTAPERAVLRSLVANGSLPTPPPYDQYALDQAHVALAAQGILDGSRIRFGLLDRWVRDYGLGGGQQ